MKATDVKTLILMVSLILKPKRYFSIHASLSRQTQNIANRNPAGPHTARRLKVEP